MNKKLLSISLLSFMSIGVASCSIGTIDQVVDTTNAITTTNISGFPSHDHDLIHHKKQEPTCTEDGNREYWSCETCNDWFWLPDGQLTILDKTTVVLEATGHKASSKWSKDNTHHWHECSQCDELLDKVEHTWDNGVITTNPTCLDTGIKTYTCTVCGQTKTEEVAALGHNPSSTWNKDETYHWHDCSQCTDKLDKVEHAWNNGVVTKEPTLEESGTKLFTCTVCGQTKEEVIDKTEITYLLSNDSTYYIVAGVKTSATKLDLVIPEEHNGLPVKEIGSRAFERMENLVSVSIPDSATSIKEYTFASCASLTSIVIPDSVTSIGDHAFYECTSLTAVTIGNGVTSIEGFAFAYCYSLKSITLPDSVTSISYAAFNVCSSLTSIVIPDSVTSIGLSAFSGCTSLTTVTIGNGVTSIESGALSNCSSLTSVTFENTEGWKTVGGTPLNLSDPATNAIFLTKTYSSTNWSRS